MTIEGETGRVDDLTLSYTYLDPGDGRLVVVPNEKVTSGVLFNHSTGDRAGAGHRLGLGAARRRPGRRPAGC